MRYRNGLWSGGSDIDIRNEIITLLNGTNLDFGRGKWVILRRLLRDGNDRLIDCMQCKKKGYHVAQSNSVCDRCFGVGFIWKEEWFKTFQWTGTRNSGGRSHEDAGTLDYETNIFYFSKDAKPRNGDRIIEVILDDEGNVPTPYIRKNSWYITLVTDHILDHGRLEYFRVLANDETVKYFGQPLNYLEPSNGSLPR